MTNLEKKTQFNKYVDRILLNQKILIRKMNAYLLKLFVLFTQYVEFCLLL